MVQQLTELSAACAQASMWPLPESDLLALLDGLHAAQQLLHAALLHAVREIDGRAIPTSHAATSTTVWLRGRLRINPGSAARMVAHAKLLDADPLLDSAVTAGKVNAEQLTAIAAALGDLPKDLDPPTREHAAATLIEWAPRLDPGGLRTSGRRILEHIAPEIVDAAEEARLQRAERQAYEQRYLTLSPLGDGRVRVRGLLDSQAAATVAAALDPLCRPVALPPAPKSGSESAPGSETGSGFETGAGFETGVGIKPWSGFEAAPDFETGLGFETGSGVEAAPGFEPAPGFETASGIKMASGLVEDRTPGQRRADALVEVCRLVLAGGDLPDNGGDRPQLAVTVAFDPLRQTLGAGILDSGASVSAATVRRIACDARVLPLVFDGDSQVLDAGRTRRLVTGPLRRALIARDRGCAFPGCDRPARWCDAHHVIPWSEGGPTELANLALLCEFHHRVVHGDSGWEIRPAQDGRPEFLPPAWLDPQRTPRTNLYHLRT
ncbi:HNH endonuclease signature motif containing protein [Actinoplanes aureus]|uniref:DUF222 domain-containing protein n=1 Tax=Actinoplanes aureus TaxID=2792083 RepID=A0A931C0S8_9ACTN|nr:HNH endonuclease signature motif containing protein [Actinoplanes aureus]MBG0561185.1 DUF222 domain-containing protein [Actinoplanes aureus]